MHSFLVVLSTCGVHLLPHACRLYGGPFLPAQHKGRLAARLWSTAAVLAAFAAFVCANGGIVVGDKANHAPVLHVMQLPYLALFCAGALAPVHFGLPRCLCLALPTLPLGETGPSIQALPSLCRSPHEQWCGAGGMHRTLAVCLAEFGMKDGV